MAASAMGQGDAPHPARWAFRAPSARAPAPPPLWIGLAAAICARMHGAPPALPSRDARRRKQTPQLLLPSAGTRHPAQVRLDHRPGCAKSARVAAAPASELVPPGAVGGLRRHSPRPARARGCAYPRTPLVFLCGRQQVLPPRTYKFGEREASWNGALERCTDASSGISPNTCYLCTERLWRGGAEPFDKDAQQARWHSPSREGASTAWI